MTQRFAERRFVHICHIAAGRDAAGELGDLGGAPVKRFFQIQRGGFAFDVGVQGENHFADIFGRNPCQEMRNGEFIRAAAVRGADRPAEDMVSAFVDAGMFDRDDVRRLSDDAKCRFFPMIIAAVLAWRLFVKHMAEVAFRDAPAELTDRIGKVLEAMLWLSQ